MSSIVVAGDTSGSVTLQAPAVAGASVLTLPVVTDTLVGKATTDTLTNKTLGSGLVAGASLLTSGTTVASTSSSQITFSPVPSWVKRITVMFNAVSTSGSSPVQIRIGSTTTSVSGYYSASSFAGSAGSYLSDTTGFLIEPTNSATAAAQRFGAVVLTLIGSNTWIANGNVANSTGPTSNSCSGVSPVLAGALTRIDIVPSNGTDTFDAGSINIMYE